MSTNIYLTDEASDIAGYRRASLGRRSDACSLVRAVTNTAAGPSSGIQVTRTAGGTALAWLTDPLNGLALTAATWTLHAWAKESNAAANAALRWQVLRWTVAEGSTVLDDNQGTELGLTTADSNLTSGAATAITLTDGDRLVIKVLVDDAGTLATGYTVTLAYNGQHPRAEGDSYLVCPDNLTVTAAVPLATRTRLRNLLLDTVTLSVNEPLLSDEQMDQALAAALRTYSKDRPRLAVDAISGDGTAYEFPLPRQWVWGSSTLQSVEYPAGEQTPTLMDINDLRIHEGVLGVQPVRVLRFATTTPESGTDNIIVSYTTRHVHTDELDTVPADDLDAVCWLAGAYAADTLAAKQAATSDSSISADVVNYQSGVDRWRAVARQLRERYQAHLGMGGKVPPAGRTVDWDTNGSLGQDRLFHPRRWR